MKGLRKAFLLFMVVSLVIVNLSAVGWTEDERTKDDPVTDEWNMIDLLVARPIGVVAGIVGTGVFILSLPFTIPTRSVDEAAQIFVVKPFKFSFERKFPDDNM
jgi:uncharacterized membrane protein YfcA